MVAKHQPKINDNMTAKHQSNSLAVDSQASSEEEATAAKASAQMTMAAKHPPEKQRAAAKHPLEDNNVVKMFKLSIDRIKRRPQRPSTTTR